MTNDLKNFLEEENKAFSSFNRFLVEPWVVEHDKRIIKKVLDLVEKDIKEYKIRIGMPSGFGENAVRADASRDTLEYISTIINQLRV